METHEVIFCAAVAVTFTAACGLLAGQFMSWVVGF
jgi:hypothetical protein